MEPTLHVISVYLFEGLEYGLHFSIGDMVYSFKAYLPSEGEKERDTVNKENICRQKYIFCVYSPYIPAPVIGRLPQG